MRQLGTYDQPFNYEVKIEGMLDARMIVPSYTDLLLFTESNYLPNGFIVSVYDTDPTKIGLYRLVDNTALDSPDSWVKIVDTTYAPYGLRNQQGFITEDNSNVLYLGDQVETGQFITSDDELSDALTRGSETQQQILDSFARYSHGKVGGPGGKSNDIPGIPLETNSWLYNIGTDAVNNSTNSLSNIGLYSRDKYESYIHSVTLSSSAADNDLIGVIIAFMEDPEDMVTNWAHGLDPDDFDYPIDTTSLTIPNQHSLILLRARGSSLTTYYIVYDYMKLTEKIIVNGSSLGGLYNTTSNWAGVTVDIRITRTEDDILGETSQFSDAPGGKGSLGFPLSFSLDSDPDLHKFKGKQSYGYTVRSQQNSSFSNISFSGNSNVIYDLRSGEVYVFGSSGYEIDTDRNFFTEIGIKREVYNEYTGKLLYTKVDHSILTLAYPPETLTGFIPYVNATSDLITTYNIKSSQFQSGIQSLGNAHSYMDSGSIVVGSSNDSALQLYGGAGSNAFLDYQLAGNHGQLKFDNITTSRVWQMPDNGGTVALVGDLSAYALDTGVVHNTGAEPVAGIKTFSSQPIFTAGIYSGPASSVFNAGVSGNISVINPGGTYGLTFEPSNLSVRSSDQNQISSLYGQFLAFTNNVAFSGYRQYIEPTGTNLAADQHFTIPYKVGGGTLALVSDLSAYAPVTGSANYIQNQVASPQTSSGLYVTGNILSSAGKLGLGVASPSTAIHAEGNEPTITLKQTHATTQSWQLISGTSIGSRNFEIYNATDSKTGLYINNEGEVRIGSRSNIIANGSRLYIFGGPNGCNIDAQGDASLLNGDQATFEAEAANYQTTAKSIAIRYFGSSLASPGTILGITGLDMAVLDFGLSGTNIIRTSSTSPILMGINNTEVGRFTTAGLSINALSIVGTGGVGLIDYIAQASTPATPSASHQISYADASGRFTIMGSNGFAASLSKSLLTASRIYTFPDAAGTFVLAGGTSTQYIKGDGSYATLAIGDITTALGYTPFNWTGFTDGSVLFTTSGVPSQDNTNFFYNSTTHSLKVTGGLGINGSSPPTYGLNNAPQIAATAATVNVNFSNPAQLSGTTTTLFHYRASQGTFTGTVTNQHGFAADANMIGAATLTTGFRGAIPSGSGRWNSYMDGTANNAFAGSVRIGSVVAPTVALDVTGAALISSTLGVGAVTATSINKVTITAPATSAILTILNGKTLTANNTLTLAGTDSTVMTFPSTSATIARTDAAQTFVGTNIFPGLTLSGSVNISVDNSYTLGASGTRLASLFVARAKPSIIQVNTTDIQFQNTSGVVIASFLDSDGSFHIGSTTTNGEKLQVDGNLSLTTAGNKIKIATGTNASVGTATLVGGTVTVSTTAVTASSKIFLTDATTGALTNIGTPTVGTIVAGTSFVINSSNVLDTSAVNWFIIN